MGVEKLDSLITRVQLNREKCLTEEATKTALVLPFLAQVLDYDVFNPDEVIPEFTADVGIKNGEKVDYAISHNGQVQLLIECKSTGTELNIHHSQLFRYFAVTTARIAILTNGTTYQFYTDDDERNIMDERPFLSFDLLEMDESLIPEIAKFVKDSFDLEAVISAAQELKVVGGIRSLLRKETKDPSDEWVKYFALQVQPKRVTQKVIDDFRPLVKKAFNEYVESQVSDELQKAFKNIGKDNDDKPIEKPSASESSNEDSPIHDGIPDPTAEEEEAFNIVRAILSDQVAVDRIHLNNRMTYCAVTLDSNNRRPIIKLHFKTKTVKHISLFGNDAVTLPNGVNPGVKHQIEENTDIFQYKESLYEAIEKYQDPKPS